MFSKWTAPEIASQIFSCWQENKIRVQGRHQILTSYPWWFMQGPAARVCQARSSLSLLLSSALTPGEHSRTRTLVYENPKCLKMSWKWAYLLLYQHWRQLCPFLAYLESEDPSHSCRSGAAKWQQGQHSNMAGKSWGVSTADMEMWPSVMWSISQDTSRLFGSRIMKKMKYLLLADECTTASNKYWEVVIFYSGKENSLQHT